MPTLKTPYNFVPVAEKVVKPYWTKYISHDIPFEDHQSGELEVTIEAESPIFVKNGMGKEEDESHYDSNKKQIKAYQFNQFKNKYFIPGSSIKGMVRSVLEIMSFGRMENKVNDVRYSVRDFNNNDIYPVSEISKTVLCGWLKKINGEYCLQDCGTPIRISYDKIDEFCDTNLADFFKEKSNNTKRTKSAKFKYTKFTKVQQRGSFSTYQTDHGTRGMYDLKEGKSGTLVMTGQPGVRQKKKDKRSNKDKWSGKFHDFIFFDSNKDFEAVEDSVIDNFFFAYYDHDVNNQQDDWKWRKIQLERGEAIPVFYRKEHGDIKDIGLAMLYKITYDYSVNDSIKNYQKNTDYDLSETIFGFVDEENKKALKGRVHFGHAFCETAQEMDAQDDVLSSPKASYYPTYIRQDVRNGKVQKYKTFMDKSAVIAGWKRYPVLVGKPKQNKGTDNVSTKFIPIKEGAIFKFKIRYHNLKKVELGALISALTFHQTEGTFHSLGMAKPLGYGKVKLIVNGLTPDKIQEYLCAFESYMNIELGNTLPEWRMSPQITELVAMASEHGRNLHNGEPYMALDDFRKVKGNKHQNGQGLDLYSNMMNYESRVKHFCTEDTIKSLKGKIKQEKKAFLNLRSNKEIIDGDIKSQKLFVEQLFEQKKQQLFKDLSSKLEAIKKVERKTREAKEKELREAKKEILQEKAKEEGIDLGNVNSSKRDAFKDLQKVVEDFARKYHKMNNNELKENFNNGFLPDAYKEDVKNKIFDIVNSSSKKIKSKFLGKSSHQYKKCAEWLGEEHAIDLFKKLQSI